MNRPLDPSAVLRAGLCLLGVTMVLSNGSHQFDCDKIIGASYG
ncbi:MAG: hypothetical protein ACE5NM_06250 [Sedimentisphaerales bacterium]